jgi:AcrR family transcriptional regulator
MRYMSQLNRTISQVRTRRFRKEASDQGKRLRTRALLMDAAVTVFAQRGVEATSISEVTATAQVSNGTFYYHFKDKPELVDAVAHAVAAALVDQVAEEIKAIEHGVERVALATQLFIKLAAADVEWGWLVVQALIDMGQFRDQISAGIREDVAIGISQGHFSIDPTDAVFTMLMSVVGVSLRQRLTIPTEQNVEVLASEMILRMLGVSSNEAAAISKRMQDKYLNQTTGAKKDSIVRAKIRIP